MIVVSSSNSTASSRFSFKLEFSVSWDSFCSAASLSPPEKDSFSYSFYFRFLYLTTILGVRLHRKIRIGNWPSFRPVPAVHAWTRFWIRWGSVSACPDFGGFGLCLSGTGNWRLKWPLFHNVWQFHEWANKWCFIIELEIKSWSSNNFLCIFFWMSWRWPCLD